MEHHDFSISNYFSNVEDPRKYNIQHSLIDIITITICALICGAQKLGRCGAIWQNPNINGLNNSWPCPMVSLLMTPSAEYFPCLILNNSRRHF